MTEDTNHNPGAEGSAHEGYELEPSPPPKKPPGDPPGGLLEGFDEDADFDHDPEVAKALGLPPVLEEQAPKEPARPMVTPGRGEPELLAGIGGVVVLVASALAAGMAPHHGLRAGVAVLLLSVLNVATGLAALSVTAHLNGLTMGRWGLAAARVLLAVAAFQIINAITLPSLGAWGRLVLIPAASGAYLLAMWALFRFPRQRLAVAAGLHLLLSFAAWLLLLLYAWAISSPGEGT